MRQAIHTLDHLVRCRRHVLAWHPAFRATADAVRTQAREQLSGHRGAAVAITLHTRHHRFATHVTPTSPRTEPRRSTTPFTSPPTRRTRTCPSTPAQPLTSPDDSRFRHCRQLLLGSRRAAFYPELRNKRDTISVVAGIAYRLTLPHLPSPLRGRTAASLTRSARADLCAIGSLTWCRSSRIGARKNSAAAPHTWPPSAIRWASSFSPSVRTPPTSTLQPRRQRNPYFAKYHFMLTVDEDAPINRCKLSP